MVLRVYNTATRRKEVFKPLVKGRVSMYVCGVTPYDESHVGHARSYVAFDVIRRVLEYLGFKVSLVQNFTDVDDKIIERGKKEGVHPLELSRKYIEEYYRDMDALGVKRADSYPLVSEHIPDIIAMVKSLVEKGLAYEVTGDVYMDVRQKRDYGKLSGQPLKDLLAGSRVEVNEKKKNPLDFALWKKAKAGEISWESPWGKGRPGWHIECSAMSIKAFGPTLDIHGGGQDLIFPHHENEQAQSESYTDKPFVRYWLHNGLVTVKGEKMSKSLGNFITISELLKKHNPQALRFFLLSAHYRRPLDFSERALDDALKGLMRIQNTIYNLKNAIEYAGEKEDGFEKTIQLAEDGFTKALEDDFNTPGALSILFDFIREVNVYAMEEAKKTSLEEALKTIEELAGALGLRFEEEVPPIVKGLIDLLLKIRSEMRTKKDFEASDRLRKQLLEIGIALEDRRQGTVWRFTADSSQS